jgi:hypothetical protein
MTINEIASFTTETVGDVSSEMVEFAKKSIRLKYQVLYDAHAWRESMRILDAQPIDPALNGTIFLPFDAEEVVFLSLSRDGRSYQRLNYRERDWIERAVPGQFSLPGDTPWYYRAENLAWPYLNPGRFTFTTSDTAPFNVYIEGKDLNGNPVNEEFTLNAILNADNTIIPSSISTANQYSMVFSLSKTAGNVKVQADFPAASTVITAGSSELVFSQFVLYPAPIFTDQNSNPIPYWFRTQVKLKADTLDNDQSVPRISHIWDALVEFTLSSLYTRARQLAKADAREAKAIAHVQAAVQIEKNQSEFRQQVTPVIYDQGDYMAASSGVSSSFPFG